MEHTDNINFLSHKKKETKAARLKVPKKTFEIKRCRYIINLFCYHRSIVRTDRSSTANIEQRLTKTQQTFGMLNAIWRSVQITGKISLNMSVKHESQLQTMSKYYKTL